MKFLLWVLGASFYLFAIGYARENHSRLLWLWISLLLGWVLAGVVGGAMAAARRIPSALLRAPGPGGAPRPGVTK